MIFRNVTMQWLAVPTSPNDTVSVTPGGYVAIPSGQGSSPELSRLIREGKLVQRRDHREVVKVASAAFLQPPPAGPSGDAGFVEQAVASASDGTRVPGDPPFDVESVASHDGPGDLHVDLDNALVAHSGDVPDIG